jgi:hypothetical protein
MAKKELLYSWSRKDFKVSTFTAGGPGGQHQNTTESAVRITHIESGISAESRSEKSQYTNKKIAFNRLAKLLVAHYVKPAENGKAPDIVIRNYHEPDDRVVDNFGNRFSYKEVIGKGKAQKAITKHTVSAIVSQS